jgi:hypothetical protein
LNNFINIRSKKYLYKIFVMANNKKRLFEVMEKVNPGFKLNENIEEEYAATTQGTTSPDAAYSQQAMQKSPTVQYANSRINTPQEFEKWFTTEFSTTGFHPQKKPIPISQVQTIVKRVMQNLGYK